MNRIIISLELLLLLLKKKKKKKKMFKIGYIKTVFENQGPSYFFILR
jgi:hypothetical protein